MTRSQWWQCATDVSACSCSWWPRTTYCAPHTYSRGNPRCYTYENIVSTDTNSACTTKYFFGQTYKNYTFGYCLNDCSFQNGTPIDSFIVYTLEYNNLTEDQYKVVFHSIAFHLTVNLLRLSTSFSTYLPFPSLSFNMH